MTTRVKVRPRGEFVLGVVVALLVLAVLSVFSTNGGTSSTSASVSPSSPASNSGGASPFDDPLPGMPPVLNHDVYAATRAGMVSSKIADEPAMLYVPDSNGNKVVVISQATRQIVDTIQAGQLSQHVVPSWDLSTLFVNSSVANTLFPIDPKTGEATGSPISVPRPYNLYFTPDGKQAIVMVEQHDIIRFSDPKTFADIADVTSKDCKGPNHADFSANGRFFLVTCEFSGRVLKISTLDHKVLGDLALPAKATAPGADPQVMGASMPQDIKLSPDGMTFYVADMGTNELVMIDAMTFQIKGAIGMPRHPHGIYPSRDGNYFYVSDRGAGEVSVLDWKTNKIVDTWVIPGGGSPDMGGVSADGSMLWLSGRYDRVVYGFDTKTGKLVAKIPVPLSSPHGLAVWPQPGRYSLGHTGNMR